MVLPKSARALARQRPLSGSPIRQLSTRPHPLASRPSPGGARPTGAAGAGLGSQRFSLTTAILLSTLVGASTYALGAQGARPAPVLGYKEPTQGDFDKALLELQTWIPEDCLATDRDSLTSHGHSDWAAHDPNGLPGAVLYPRSTEDVVKIVKLASKFGIPLIPYSAGTSLEGELSSAVAFCAFDLTSLTQCRSHRCSRLPQQSQRQGGKRETSSWPSGPHRGSQAGTRLGLGLFGEHGRDHRDSRWVFSV